MDFSITNPPLSPFSEGGSRRGWRTISDEKGAALVLALLIVTVLAVFSLTTVITATQGLKVTSGYRTDQQLLYQSDGGADFATGFILRAFDNKKRISPTDTANTNLTINTTDSNGDGITNLEDEIAGTTANSADTLTTNPNLVLNLQGASVAIDIDYVTARQIKGSSTEFGSRYEGIGMGGSGATGIIYKVDSLTTSADGRSSTVRIRYKCVENQGFCL